MAVTIGSNIASLRAQRRLFENTKKIGTVFERLASGQRINRASDDAAGLAIAESLKKDQRVFTQGVRNFNDGLSLLNIADGALAQLSGLTTRLVELAEQAANGVLSNVQRSSLDEEAQALSEEYFRIVQSTEFNGRQLLTADLGELRLQGGYGLDGGIAQSLGGAVGTGEFSLSESIDIGTNPYEVIAGDFNNDGNQDLITTESSDNTITVLLGDGAGNFEIDASYATGTGPENVDIADMDNDGNLDLVVTNLSADTISVFKGDGNGAFSNFGTYTTGSSVEDASFGDFDNDGILDIISSDEGDNTISFFKGAGDGTFLDRTTSTFVAGRRLETGDFNGDGTLDVVSVEGPDRVRYALGNGDGSFAATMSIGTGTIPYGLQLADLNNDDILDIITSGDTDNTISVYFGNGDGTFESRQTYAGGGSSVVAGDFNGDGFSDVATSGTIHINNGDGTLSSSTTLPTLGSTRISSADINNDGVLDLFTTSLGPDTLNILIGETTSGVSPLLDFSLETLAGARQALPQFQRKLDQLSEQRGQIGAFQSRINVGSNVLQVTAENASAAASRIQDADIADESANLVRLNILQQATAAVLAQANTQPSLALQLLGGG